MLTLSCHGAKREQAPAGVASPQLLRTANEDQQMYDTSTLSGTSVAPELPKDDEWFNTPRPLTLRELRGKVVLLDFWTYCCINCMHIIPDLKKLEDKYRNELVVVGVHSAKFETEQIGENIRQAIMRYEVTHPVVNDTGMRIWDRYGVHAWPTLVLINPEGRIVGQASGEGVYDTFDGLIGQLADYYGKQGKLDATLLKLKPEAASAPAHDLDYPGKLAYDAAHQRLALSDSNHNRILLFSLDGAVQEIIGGEDEGFADGDFNAARFHRPQGVCFDPSGTALYIADTENHAVRVADLAGRAVTTLAGTGEQAQGLFLGRRGRELRLSSPWDVVLVGKTLYVAMAGLHQIWGINVDSGEAVIQAGSGMENIIDGELRQSALAQPSGITTDGTRLYFADSEVSAVREADIAPNGAVHTLIGVGLFDFGDIDGAYPSARLQHPLGVDWHEGAVYVADSYNHKVKRVDPETRTVTTLIGTGQPGHKDGEALKAQLYEPADVCWAGDKLYIADTNNHSVRVYSPASGMVSTLKLRFP